jgi:hypothetical protein
MATVKKMVKKAQSGVEKSKATPKGYVRGEMTNKLYKKEVMDKWEKGVNESLDKAAGTGKYYAPKKVAKTKMQNGGKKAKSFPDLNKDGKITKADILKGRGVIAKHGAGVHKMKMGGKAAKQAAIAISMKKAGVTPKKKMQYGGLAASMEPTMKKGGTVKKCKYGCK